MFSLIIHSSKARTCTEVVQIGVHFHVLNHCFHCMWVQLHTIARDPCGNFFRFDGGFLDANLNHGKTMRRPSELGVKTFPGLGKFSTGVGALQHSGDAIIGNQLVPFRVSQQLAMESRAKPTRACRSTTHYPDPPSQAYSVKSRLQTSAIRKFNV